jgi:hypothetical protein
MATNPDRASYFPAIEKKYGQPMSYWFDQMDEIADRKYPEQIAFLRENHGFSQAHAQRTGHVQPRLDQRPPSTHSRRLPRAP